MVWGRLCRSDSRRFDESHALTTFFITVFSFPRHMLTHMPQRGCQKKIKNYHESVNPQASALRLNLFLLAEGRKPPVRVMFASSSVSNSRIIMLIVPRTCMSKPLASALSRRCLLGSRRGSLRLRSRLRRCLLGSRRRCWLLGSRRRSLRLRSRLRRCRLGSRRRRWFLRRRRWFPRSRRRRSRLWSWRRRGGSRCSRLGWCRRGRRRCGRNRRRPIRLNVRSPRCVRVLVRRRSRGCLRL